MTTTLASPKSLSVRPLGVTIPSSTYRHNEQRRFDSSNQPMMITFNATQTFDGSGRPKDSDNDK
jgi:hypothetical protein